MPERATAAARSRPAEPNARWAVHAMAIATGLLGVWYFAWLLQPERIGQPVLFAILVSAEVFNVLQATGFTWTCANQRVRPVSRLPGAENVLVDVFIPVYNEPPDIVEPTVAAAARLRGARVRVALLDDGRSPEMAAVAESHGVAYITRESRSGAKAGNINNALTVTSAPYVVVLDCDHVPEPSLLEATLGHFADEKAAFVQTPQHYTNARASAVSAAAAAQQNLFFGPIAGGKEGLGATFCYGTNVVFRRTALADVGGFPEGSLTEDFALSVKLHERGWRSVYVPQILARGLGPEDMASYVSQQQRWARGCLTALPLVLKARLPWRLRLQYLLSATYFLTGWTLLIYMSMPVIRILTGEQPLAALTANEFVIHFVPYFCAALLTVSIAGRGAYTFRAFALAAASFWIHIHATLTALLRRPARFVVTPKHGATERQPRAVAPTIAVIAILLAVSVYGLLRDRSAGTLNNVAFVGLHLAVLITGVLPAFFPGRRLAPETEGSRPLLEPASAAGHRWSWRAAWPLVAAALIVPAAGAHYGSKALSPLSTPPESARAATERFFSRHLEPNGRVVRTDQGGDTVSEGQAYAMLLAVAANDEARFRTVWRWTRIHLQRPDGLFAYRWAHGRVRNAQPATDADLDAARALVLAAERFGEPDYRTAGRRLGRAIVSHETKTVRGRLVLVAGPWARKDPLVLNPSYFSPRAYAALGRVERADRWSELAASSHAITARLMRRPTALPPDWAAMPASGGPPRAAGTPGPRQYGLDAARVVIRLAESCGRADRRLAAGAWPFLARAASTTMAGAYTLRGARLNAPEHPVGLVAAAAAADAAGATEERNRLLDRAEALDEEHPTYYGAAWVALTRVMLTTRALGGCRE